MRIAQIATLTETVPPTWHGGIELIISLITEELVKRGHEVTLFAAAGSKTSANLVKTCRFSFRGAGKPDILMDFIHASRSFQRAGEFDIIHNHTDYFGLGFVDYIKTPVVTTLHSPFSEEEAQNLLRSFKHLNYVALSYGHRRVLPPELNVVRVIYNGIDVDSFPFEENKDDYMLFLGRIHPDKGTHIAIDIARSMNKTLVIAAQIDRYNRRYFEEIIQPQIDGKLIIFVGEIDQNQKRELLKKASCTLFPVTWNEPFGLVMVESLACGTPVIALNKGSVPEIIDHEKTGFIAESQSGLEYGIEQLEKIKPINCRKHVQENFTYQKMVDNYLILYEQLIQRYKSTSKTFTFTINSHTSCLLPSSLFDLLEFLNMSVEYASCPLSEEQLLERLQNSKIYFSQDWDTCWTLVGIKPTNNDLIKEYYRRSPWWIYDLYARFLEVKHKEWMSYIADKCIEYNLRNIIHYGSGIGEIAFYISPNHKLTLAELNSQPFEFSKWWHKKYGIKNIEYIDIDSKDLENKQFDGLICIDFLEHYFNPIELFKKITSYIKPDGILFLFVNFMESYDYPQHLEENIKKYRYTFNPLDMGFIRLNNREPAVYRKQIKKSL